MQCGLPVWPSRRLQRPSLQTVKLAGFQVVAGLAEIFRWQSRRSDDVPSTSALAPWTDIISAADQVRKVPQRDSCIAAITGLATAQRGKH